MSGSSKALLEDENRELKSQVQQLRRELSQKDALIASLEAQIKSLIKDGDILAGRKGSADAAKPRSELPPKAPNHRPPSSRRHTDDDDDESTLPPHTGRTSRRPSLDPPTRSSVEMASPLPAPRSVKDTPRLLNRADVLESGVGTLITESIIETGEEEASDDDEGNSSSRRCLNKTKGAIKALPRELSIFNSDDDDVTRYSIDDNMPTYHLESEEMRDAYNARGLYTGSVSRSEQMPHGRGRMKYHHQGRSYEGDWVSGHWHGLGKIQNANGDVYEGEVQNDLREGKGRLYYADGRIFDGKFHQDDPIHGTLSFPDGAKYLGELHNGARVSIFLQLS